MTDEELAHLAQEALTVLLNGKTLVSADGHGAVTVAATWATPGLSSGVVLQLSDGSRIQLLINAQSSGDPDGIRTRKLFEELASRGDPAKVARMLAYLNAQVAQLPESFWARRAEADSRRA
jgi:hypothetical protein